MSQQTVTNLPLSAMKDGGDNIDTTKYKTGAPPGPAKPQAAAVEKPTAGPDAPEADARPPGHREVIGMEMRMEHLMQGKPECSIETDLAGYLGFLGRKYGVSIRNASYTRKGREETVVVRAVIEQMPARGVQRSWKHSGGGAVSEWREQR